MAEQVLVTGADGFVGKAVCRSLLESGYTPRAGLWNAEVWPALQAATHGLSERAVIGDLGANPNLRTALEDLSGCAARLDHGNALTVERRHQDRAGGSGHRALLVESVKVPSRIRKDLFQTRLETETQVNSAMV